MVYASIIILADVKAQQTLSFKSKLFHNFIDATVAELADAHV